MIKIYRIIFIFLLFLAIANTGLAYQLADLPPGEPVTFDEVNRLIEQIANFMVVTSVLLAIIYIIWGGITYMSAGSDTTKVTEAQTRIKNGIIGAAIVLGVGVIINTIAGIVSRDFFCQFRIPIIGTCLY